MSEPRYADCGYVGLTRDPQHKCEKCKPLMLVSEADAKVKQAKEDAFNEVEGYLRDQYAELRVTVLTEFGQGAASAFCQTIAQLKYLKARAKS